MITHSVSERPPDMKRIFTRRLMQIAFSFGIQFALLFAAAGTLKWWQAWVYAGLNVSGVIVNSVILLRVNPVVIASRARTEGVKDWDKIVGTILSVIMLALPALAGLDKRFGWTGELPLWVLGMGVVSYLISHAILLSAMAVNPFFSGVVRIQPNDDHTTISTGPYRFVRHPGYVGMFFNALSTVFLLGSLWAIIPGGLAWALLVVRTALEDRTLIDELPGYKEYARQTRYRLIPGIW